MHNSFFPNLLLKIEWIASLIFSVISIRSTHQKRLKLEWNLHLFKQRNKLINNSNKEVLTLKYVLYD